MRKYKKNKIRLILSSIMYIAFLMSISAQEKYNVLFIAVDDLNDYVSILEDYPGIKTPNLDKFSEKAISFTQAYTAAPVCNPSRAAVLSGLSPVTTGLYDNEDHFQNSPVILRSTLLPEHFKNNGYRTMWSGKIFHSGGPDYISRPDEQRIKAMWDDMKGHDGGYGPNAKISSIPDSIKRPGLFEYEVWKGEDTDFPDVVNTDITIERLQENYDSPFFIAMGLYRPHNPWTAPKRFFDMYPLEQVKVPEVPQGDLDDIPGVGKEWAKGPVNFHDIKNANQWKPIVRSYLASISFMDFNLGRILNALENSKYKDNTIVVLWSDHGFHMGEKNRFAKYALWEKTTHTLLMLRIPGAAEGERRNQPVNLLDIYPTLIDYCGLPEVNQELNGISLRKVIEDESYERATPSITYYRGASIGVRSKDWRYIRYYDGTEELYNHQNDPCEWKNLAGDPNFHEIKKGFQKWLPTEVKQGVGPIKN